MCSIIVNVDARYSFSSMQGCDKESTVHQHGKDNRLTEYTLALVSDVAYSLVQMANHSVQLFSQYGFQQFKRRLTRLMAFNVFQASTNKSHSQYDIYIRIYSVYILNVGQEMLTPREYLISSYFVEIVSCSSFCSFPVLTFYYWFFCSFLLCVI